MVNKINKVVLPVAGLGTRFLPATKVVAKELLPVVDKPLIQYAVEEAVEAGISEVIFVTSPQKKTIEDHFRINRELDEILAENNKEHYLDSLNNLISKIKVSTVIQEKPLGLGHAILCARDSVGGEDFAVILPDDLIATQDHNCLVQMMEIYNKNNSSVIAVEPVQETETEKYGIVSIKPGTVKSGRIIKIVEKPKPHKAPSHLGVVGRYILPGSIFDILDNISAGAGGEFQLTDAISAMLTDYEFIAYQFDGIRYDCGSKLGYLKANIQYGLKQPDINSSFDEYISTLGH